MIDDWLRDFGDTTSDHIWQWLLGRGLILLLIALLGFVIYKISSVIIYKAVYHVVYTSRKRKMPLRDAEKRAHTLAGLTRMFWRIAIIAGAVGLVVHVLFPGVNFGALVAGFGVVGIAVGFGAQSLIKDMFAGLFIVSENQYRVGDRVTLKASGIEATGRVVEIGVRTTVLRDDKDNVHFLPNGSIVHVINKSLHYQWDGQKEPGDAKRDLTLRAKDDKIKTGEK